MQLKLDHNFASSFELKEGSADLEDGETYDLQYRAAFKDDEAKSFIVIFRLQLEVMENIALNVEYVSVFKTEEEIDQSFKDSHFPHVNAPAIAFPFLRAFVAQLTLMAGYKPVVLPSINFTLKKPGALLEAGSSDV